MIKTRDGFVAQHQTAEVRDVVIIGGGAAGLSAALTLARARRSVTVADSGQPRNASAHAAHGLLGQEGVNPLALLAKGRDEAAEYGAEILSVRVTDTAVVESGFTLTLEDGRVLTARQLLIGTGVRDEFPNVVGLRERWGRDVVHCPYCHGWEIRDQRIGLLATGPMSVMQALLFRQWSDQITFLPNGMRFGRTDLAKLTAVGIPVIDGPVAAVEVADDRLIGVRFHEGALVELDALAVPTLTRVRLDGLDGLGIELETNAAGTTIKTDPAGRANIEGVWAAGNAVNPGFQISEAAANGARAAMTINTELVFQDAAAREATRQEG